MPYVVKLRRIKGKDRVEFHSILGSRDPDLVVNLDHYYIKKFFEDYLQNENGVEFDKRRKMFILRDRSTFERVVLYSILLSHGKITNERFVAKLVETIGGYDLHFWVSNAFEIFERTRNLRSVSRVIKAFKILYGLA